MICQNPVKGSDCDKIRCPEEMNDECAKVPTFMLRIIV